MLDVTFLEAKIGHLAKVVRPEHIEPYPLAKQFKSTNLTCPSMLMFEQAIRHHSAQGHCLHVGSLRTQLDDFAPRAGLADSSKPLTWFCLDIDGLPARVTATQYDKQTVIDMVEDLRTLLPAELARATVIAQASTKQGLKPGIYSMHLFFGLKQPVEPALLKQYIKALNYRISYFKDSVGLSKNGHSLTYALDITTADRGRLLYITPPIFDRVTDPFASPDDRIVLVTGDHDLVDLVNAELPDLSRQEPQLKRELRVALGFNGKVQEKIRTVTLDGQRVDVLTNPEAGQLTFAFEARGYRYYNLNNGDSAAYYHANGKPDVIFNFKGEPAFRWADVDSISFEEYCREFGHEILAANPIMTFMCVEQKTDRILKVWYRPTENHIQIVPSKSERIEDFYAENGQIEPLGLLTWDIQFNPTQNERIDMRTRTLNLFNPSPLMMEQPALPPEIAANLRYGNAALIEQLCPYTWILLNHLVNYQELEVNHLVNWLAKIFQDRVMTEQALVFQGTFGTGKGTLHEMLLQPVFGRDNAIQKLGTDVVNDTFDSWRENRLIICLDEFDHKGAKNSAAMMGRIKSWVTESETSIRAMNIASTQAENHTNWILFVNEHDFMQLGENDRRFTVFSRQEQPLDQVVDTEALYRAMPGEVSYFAAALQHWQVDERKARKPLENTAKQIAREAAQSPTDTFCHALLSGNLDAMLPVFEESATNPEKLIAIKAAQAIVRNWAKGAGAEIRIPMNQLREVYNVLNGLNLTAVQFGKSLARRGVVGSQQRTPDGRQKCVVVTFASTVLTPEQLASLGSHTEQRAH